MNTILLDAVFLGILGVLFAVTALLIPGCDRLNSPK